MAAWHCDAELCPTACSCYVFHRFPKNERNTELLALGSRRCYLSASSPISAGRIFEARLAALTFRRDPGRVARQLELDHAGYRAR
jgi:hypothetical protein